MKYQIYRKEKIMKKYEITNETICVCGKTLYRIKSLIDFDNVTQGTLGGFIEKESNLSHDNNAWVYDDAKVYDNAMIYGNAKVYDNAMIYGNAEVYDDAKVYDNAMIYGNAEVYDDAKIYGNAWVYDDAKVYDNAKVRDNAWVYGNAEVYDNAKVYNGAKICGDTTVYGDAMVHGIAKVYGNAKVCDDAEVRDNTDYLCFMGLGSYNRNTTFFKCRDGHIRVSCGCFHGDLTEFENQVRKTHGDTKYAKEYLACVTVVKIHFGIE